MSISLFFTCWMYEPLMPRCQDNVCFSSVTVKVTELNCHQTYIVDWLTFDFTTIYWGLLLRLRDKNFTSVKLKQNQGKYLSGKHRLRLNHALSIITQRQVLGHKFIESDLTAVLYTGSERGRNWINRLLPKGPNRSCVTERKGVTCEGWCEKVSYMI